MPPAALMQLPDLEWISLLRDEVEKGRSVAAVARDVGIPRPSLSMLLAGTYPAGLDKVSRKYAAKVIALFRSQVLCPHQRKGISSGDCRALASAPMSTSNPDRLSQFIACRKCPQNPTQPIQKEA